MCVGGGGVQVDAKFFYFKMLWLRVKLKLLILFWPLVIPQKIVWLLSEQKFSTNMFLHGFEKSISPIS